MCVYVCEQVYSSIFDMFEYLPLAALVSEKMLVLHGGVGDGSWGLSALLVCVCVAVCCICMCCSVLHMCVYVLQCAAYLVHVMLLVVLLMCWCGCMCCSVRCHVL